MNTTNEDRRKKGFIDVDGYGDEGELYRWCVEHRLILRDVYEDFNDVLYGKGGRPIVLSGEFDDFTLYKIGTRREFILKDGEIPEWLIEFIKREKEYQREFIKRAREKKKGSGEYAGGNAPYGYYAVNKSLHIDDYESFVVKFIFYRDSQGCSHYGIAKELNLRGFRNRKGNKFQTVNVDKIVENKRLYQGYITYDGVESRAKFRGILEDSEELLTEEWKNRVFDAQAEARIEEHRRRHHSENSVPHEIRPYILVGNEPKKKGRRNL